MLMQWPGKEISALFRLRTRILTCLHQGEYNIINPITQPSYLLDAPVGTSIRLNASLSFLKTRSLDSSTTLPSNPTEPVPSVEPAAVAVVVAILFLFLLPNPSAEPQTTIHSPTHASTGTIHPAQTLVCLPIFARRSIVARVSMIAASSMAEPGRIFARGDIVTEWEIAIRFLSSLSPSPFPCSDVSVVECDCIPGPGLDEDASGDNPIMHFSPITHPLPIRTGPSKEYILARGWMIVSASMDTG